MPEVHYVTVQIRRPKGDDPDQVTHGAYIIDGDKLTMTTPSGKPVRAWGIQMAISQDHSAFPAHAHNNLLGFVCLFLFGIYYYLHPSLEQNRAAKTQVWIWIVAVAILDVGIGMVHTGHPNGDPIAAVGSLIALADMLLFGWLVLRTERGLESSRAMPAE